MTHAIHRRATATCLTIALVLPAALATASSRPSACIASAPRAARGAASGVARARAFREALAPCLQSMHGRMHAALDGDAPDADALFAAAMIPHHEGAIDMARQQLVHGRDPQLRAAALAIIAEQQAEVDLLRGWLARRAAGRSPARRSP